MAAKRTADLIPLCHPLPLTKAAVTIEPDEALPGFRVAAEVRTVGVTGVEMEALTAVSVACLTLFDMLKAIDRTMEISSRAGDLEAGRPVRELVPRMIRFDEAPASCRRMRRARSARESVPLAQAAGRVLAAPVVAMVDSPPADVSAMDGYAVREADLPGAPSRRRRVASRQRLRRRARARDLRAHLHRRRRCPPARIASSSRRMSRRDGDIADHRRPAGHGAPHQAARLGFRARATSLLEAGRLLDPRALVAAAGADRGRGRGLAAARLVLSSAPATSWPIPAQARGRPGAIPESVSFGVAALAEQWGGRAVGAPAPARTICRRWSGRRRGARAGRSGRRHRRRLGRREGFRQGDVRAAGLELIFSKVAIKPGKPVWLGRAGGKLVIGLPGNPTSAMVTARLLLAPLVAGLAAAARQRSDGASPAGRAAPGLRRPRDLPSGALRGEWRGAARQPGFQRAEGAGRGGPPSPQPRARSAARSRA